MRARRPLAVLLLLLLAGCGSSPGQAGAPAEAGVRPIDSEFAGSEVAIDLPWLVIHGPDGLTAFNLESGKSQPVPVQGKLMAGFAVGGGKVVWSDLRHESRDPLAKDERGQLRFSDVALNWDVMLMDLKTGEVRSVAEAPGAQRRPHTDGRYVVWEDFRDDHSTDLYGYPDIYLFDLQTGKERRLTDAPGGQFQPRVGGGKVVWMDGRNNEAGGTKRGCDNCPDNNWNVYYYDIAAGREYPVATHQYMEESPDVSGDRIAWIERTGYRNAAVVLLDLKSGKRERLTDDKANRSHVRIAGTRVVWTDERRGPASEVNPNPAGSDIFLYDAATHKAVRLTGNGPQLDPAVSGNRVAFVLGTQVNPRVQVVTVP